MSKAFVKEDSDAEPEDNIEEPALGSGPRYITPEGYKRLQAERDELWSVERPRVTAMVSAAAAEGDRSENAEYIYGKKRLRQIDARLHSLHKLLERLTVVQPREQGDRVFFGAWVTLENENGQVLRYRIVGPDESDSNTGQISVESPVAKALLGRSAGHWVTVFRPKGPADFLIREIHYRKG